MRDGRYAGRAVRTDDFTGRVFGRLTVLGRDADRPSHNNYWLCQCSCGNLSVARHDHLIEGHHRSCGCLRDEAAARRRVPHELRHRSPESCVKDLFNVYRRAARIRGHEFSLSFDEFKDLTSQCCTYCGCPPSIRHTPKIKGVAKWRIQGGYTYNGIDRVDSALGYASTNVTTCCAQCNRAKLDYSVQDFKEWIVRVYHHLNLDPT